MQTKIKYSLYLVATLITGVVIGALLFSGGGASTGGEGRSHQHTTESETWTCSMHPQIRQPEPGKCPICGMDLIPVSEEEGSSDPLTLKMSERAIKLAGVQTAVVEADHSVKLLTLNGRIAVDERRVFTQTAHFPGRIEQLYVNFTGEYVLAGEQIATVYSPELVTAQEELLEAKRFAEANPQLLEAARTKLKQWKLTDEQIRQIEASQQVQEEFPVLADRSGYVIDKHVTFGDHLMLGEPLFDMADLSQVWVEFDAYEDDLSWIQVGDEVTLQVKSLPGQTFMANISFIDPVINQQTRVAVVRAELSNPKGSLKPEMFVTGTVEADIAAGQKQLVIPRSAVLWTGTRSIVYVKQPDTESPSFQLREITLGPAVGSGYVVEDGLATGEEIVVEGTYTIDAASELADKPSMMNPEANNDKGAFSEVPDYRTAATPGFLQQMKIANQHYLEMQRMLVEADYEGAQAEAKALLTALPPVRSFTDAIAQSYWKGRYAGIRQATVQITQAETIDQQRKAFVNLSNDMVRTNVAFGTATELFLVYCPMANNDEGAYWLSDVEEVLNPYYGDMMLRCGEVEKQINP